MSEGDPRKGQIRPERRLGAYSAPGDAPLTVPSLELEVPFEFDASFAGRLVRRDVNPKEAFTVRDHQDAYFRASLRQLGRQGGVAVPYEQMPRSPEPVVEITLACAVLARQRMIFVVQKATELGVSRIVPLLTGCAVARDGLEHERAHAWPGQVIRAAKQCRRSSLPELLPPTSLDAFLASPAAQADLSVFLDDRSRAAPPPMATPRRMVLLVGPEGGFTDAERDQIKGRAFPWVLGGRVLRAETAVLAGLTAIHLTWGDFCQYKR